MTRKGATGESWWAGLGEEGGVVWWWWEGRKDGGSGRALAEWGRVGSDSSSSFLILLFFSLLPGESCKRRLRSFHCECLPQVLYARPPCICM